MAETEMELVVDFSKLAARYDNELAQAAKSLAGENHPAEWHGTADPEFMQATMLDAFRRVARRLAAWSRARVTGYPQAKIVLRAPAEYMDFHSIMQMALERCILLEAVAARLTYQGRGGMPETKAAEMRAQAADELDSIVALMAMWEDMI